MPQESELTDEMIAVATAKADARVCLGSDRCIAFPDRLEDARETCTPKGRCKVGWHPKGHREQERPRELERLARGSYGAGQARPALGCVSEAGGDPWVREACHER